jgi:hypothetical protein
VNKKRYLIKAVIIPKNQKAYPVKVLDYYRENEVREISRM